MKPTIVVVTLAAIVLTLSGCDSPEERLAKHYARGVDLVETGEPVRARLEFRNALRLDENHVPSRFAMAELMEADGDLRAAAANFRLVAELDQTHVESRLRLARIYLLAAAFDDALAAADAALALAPDDADVLAVRAAVSLRLENLDEATELAQRALDRDPAHVEAGVVLASVDVARGDIPAALARIDAMLGERPELLALNLLKLQVLERAGDEAGLGAHIDRLVELYPDDARFARIKVRWSLARGDLDGAETLLRGLADAAPGEAGPALDLARFLNERRGDDVAQAELARRAESASDPAVADTLRLASVEFDLAAGRTDAARAKLEALIAERDGSEAANDARVRLARIRIADGDKAAAAALVDAVLANDEGDVGALALRTAMLIDDNRPSDAVQVARRALDADPQNVQLLLLAAQAHAREGNLSLAGERYAAAMRASNVAPDVAMQYARFLEGRGEIDNAAIVLSESAARNPAHRETLARLAELRLRLSDWTGAEEVAAQLRAMEDGAETADKVQAAALSGLGRIDESIAILERLAEGRDDFAAVSSLVTSYVRNGEVDRARRFVDEILAENPDNVRALLLRAEIHLVEGDPAGAETRLRRIIAAAPDDPLGYVTLARLKLRLGDVEAAESAARTGVETLPDDRNAGVRLLLAEIVERRGGFDEAIEHYRALYAVSPDSIVVANNLASLLAEHRAGDAAELDFAARVSQRLRGLEQPEFRDTYGWIAFLNGDVDEALRHLIPAAEALPNNALVRFHAGRALASAGRTEDARGHLEAALAVDPAFPRASEAREALAALPTN